MKIVYTQDNGFLAVINLSDDTDVDEAVKSYLAQNIEYSLINDDELPNDLTYRDAWILTSGKVTLDEEKIKVIDQAELKPLTRRQFKLTLYENNLIEKIEAAIESIQEPYMKDIIKIEYNESTEFQRTSNSVITMCSLLELTDDQVNEMWSYALTL